MIEIGSNNDIETFVMPKSECFDLLKNDSEIANVFSSAKILEFRVLIDLDTNAKAITVLDHIKPKQGRFVWDENLSNALYALLQKTN